ncbi:MAG: HAMP domain-containing protein [Verrucomicrobia bacterium]|nr:HAMP domain-containing protein [Verrucomicrobiota bacterium]
MKLSLPWKWFAALAGLLGALLLIVNVCIEIFLPPYLVGQIRNDLARDARLASELFAAKLAAVPPAADINAVAHGLARSTALRVTVIAPDGVVIGESDKPSEQLARIENHLQRPEVQDALKPDGPGLGSAIRHSDTINVDLLYVAVAVRAPDGNVQGFVRVALPLHTLRQTTSHVNRTVALASIVVGALAIPLLFWTARRTTRPLLQMRDVAARVARGDFSQRVPPHLSGELGELGGALNDMSAQLEARLRELTQDKAELSAILASMRDGVLVVDAGGKVRLVNQALRQQFELGDEVTGKTVLEAFRNVTLDELIAEARSGGEIATRELNILAPAERIFEVNATALRAGAGDRLGAVAVFHDIKRLKQLENMRKEFVANVSHELRTPLSIIKGYVETLLDPHPPEPDAARQFLQTIQRHSRRLEALIGDLLSISALESQQARLNFEPLSLRAVAQAVADELDRQAKEKNIAVKVEIPADFHAVRGDAHRLHQVFFNLLDNAVKYTHAGGNVTVTAVASDNDGITVCVADNGPGIAAGHLPHIFERFYRVDKARSRELGGTGLGLAIVKHIVLAHGGKAWAESELEKGSRFYFTLPRA